MHLKKSTKDNTISIVKVISVVVLFSIVGDGLCSFKCILDHYWNNYFNSGRYFISGWDVKLSLKFILNHYWNIYFNSGRYFISGCDVKLSLKCIINHYWNNYFNSGRYFNSGCNNYYYIWYTKRNWSHWHRRQRRLHNKYFTLKIHIFFSTILHSYKIFQI